MDDFEETVFHRLSTAVWWSAGSGAVLAVTPIDGLFVGAAINTGPGHGLRHPLFQYTVAETVNEDGNYVRDVPPVLARSQYAVGYTIPNIGLVRAGYFGTSHFGMAEYLQAAFRLTAVPNLMIDVGGGYSLDAEIANIGLVGTYRMQAFTIGLGAGFYGISGDDDAVMRLRAYLNPAYDLDFATVGMGLLLNVGDLSEFADTMTFGVGAFIMKNVSGGSIKAGVTLNVPAGFAGEGGEFKPNIAVPIEITYSIW